MFRQATNPQGVLGLDRLAAYLNAPDDAFLVDDVGRALGEPNERHQNTVLSRDCLVCVAQDGKPYAEFLSKSSVLGCAVHADPDKLRACGFEFGNISLIRSQLLLSSGSEGFNIKSQHHILLAAKVAQLHKGTILVE